MWNCCSRKWSGWAGSVNGITRRPVRFQSTFSGWKCGSLLLTVSSLGASPLPCSFRDHWWGHTGNGQDPMVCHVSHTKCVTIWPLTSYAHTTVRIERKLHLWVKWHSFKKETSLVNVGGHCVGLTTSCLGPLGSGLCFLLWVCWVLQVPGGAASSWRTWGIPSATSESVLPCALSCLVSGVPSRHEAVLPLPPHLPAPADLLLIAWRSDDTLKMASLQESEKLFLFNLQTEIKQAVKLVEKAGFNYTLKKSKIENQVIRSVKKAKSTVLKDVIMG